MKKMKNYTCGSSGQWWKPAALKSPPTFMPCAKTCLHTMVSSLLHSVCVCACACVRACVCTDTCSPSWSPTCSTPKPAALKSQPTFSVSAKTCSASRTLTFSPQNLLAHKSLHLHSVCVCVCVCACMRACLPACVHACVRVCRSFLYTNVS